MKIKSILIVFLVLTLSNSYGQSPNQINYQSIIRNSDGLALPNQNVELRFSILETSENGSVVYQEEHSEITNSYGLINLKIGLGNVLSGNFDAINWGGNSYFLKIEFSDDNMPGFETLGIQRLISVPYALHANTADSISGGLIETDPVFQNSVAHGITSEDTMFWNNHLDSTEIADLGFVTSDSEEDPVFQNSVAHGITSEDTMFWNNQLDSTDIVNMQFLQEEVDGDTTNELQSLSIVNDSIHISSGNGVPLSDVRTKRLINFPIRYLINSSQFTPQVELSKNQFLNGYDIVNPNNLASAHITKWGVLVPRNGKVVGFNSLSRLQYPSTGGLKEIQFRVYKANPIDGAVATQVGNTIIMNINNSSTVLYNSNEIFTSGNDVSQGDVIIFTVKRVDCTASNCPPLNLEILGNILVEVEE